MQYTKPPRLVVVVNLNLLIMLLGCNELKFRLQYLSAVVIAKARFIIHRNDQATADDQAAID